MQRIIKYLQTSVKYCKKNKENLDSKSWGYQEGILLTPNEAIKLIDAIKKQKSLNRKKLISVINKVVDEHQCLCAQRFAY